MQKQPSRQQSKTSSVSRRNLLRNGAVAAGAAATFTTLCTNYAWAQVSEEIKVGVIGAGGRASGAVRDHTEAVKALGLASKIVSVCDMFPKQAKGLADKYKVPAEKTYAGLDGYKQVLESERGRVESRLVRERVGGQDIGEPEEVPATHKASGT